MVEIVAYYNRSLDIITNEYDSSERIYYDGICVESKMCPNHSMSNNILCRILYIPRTKFILLNGTDTVKNFKGNLSVCNIERMCVDFLKHSHHLYQALSFFYTTEFKDVVAKLCGSRNSTQLDFSCREQFDNILKTFVDKVLINCDGVESSYLDSILNPIIISKGAIVHKIAKSTRLNFIDRKLNIIFSLFDRSLATLLEEHVVYFSLLCRNLNIESCDVNFYAHKSFFFKNNCEKNSTCKCMWCELDSFTNLYIDVVPRVCVMLNDIYSKICVGFKKMFEKNIVSVHFNNDDAGLYKRVLSVHNYHPLNTNDLTRADIEKFTSDSGFLNKLSFNLECILKSLFFDISNGYVELRENVLNYELSVNSKTIFDYAKSVLDQVDTIFINCNSFNYSVKLGVSIRFEYSKHIHTSIFLSSHNFNICSDFIINAILEYINSFIHESTNAQSTMINRVISGDDFIVTGSKIITNIAENEWGSKGNIYIQVSPTYIFANILYKLKPIIFLSLVNRVGGIPSDDVIVF